MRRSTMTKFLAAAAASGLAGTALAVPYVGASEQQPTNWYRADAVNGVDANGAPNALPADTAPVQVWQNLGSRVGNNAVQNATASRRPRFRANVTGPGNTLPVVRFNFNSDVGDTALNQFLQFAGAIANEEADKLTMFVVAQNRRADASTNRDGLISTRPNATFNSGAFLTYGARPTSDVARSINYAHTGHGIGPTSSTFQTHVLPADEFNLFRVARNGPTSELAAYGDAGEQITSGRWNTTTLGDGYNVVPPNANGSSLLTLLGVEGTNFLVGDIAEIVIYDKTLLGARDQKIVTNYLGEKYAILGADLPAQAGDTNIDYQVDFTDLVVLAQNYNVVSGATRSTGDLDGDGAVGFSDLVILAQNYNVGVGTAAAPENASATFVADWAMAVSLVPEPTTLAAIGLAAPLMRRRRKA